MISSKKIAIDTWKDLQYQLTVKYLKDEGLKVYQFTFNYEHNDVSGD
jgi:hypothetical protein